MMAALVPYQIKLETLLIMQAKSFFTFKLLFQPMINLQLITKLTTNQKKSRASAHAATPDALPPPRLRGSSPPPPFVHFQPHLVYAYSYHSKFKFLTLNLKLILRFFFIEIYLFSLCF
jgi:hypothetical protein